MSSLFARMHVHDTNRNEEERLDMSVSQFHLGME